MSVGTADLFTAIAASWEACGLNLLFSWMWPSDVNHADFIALNDQEASPHQPFPYCVMEVVGPRVSARMSAGAGSKREFRNYDVTFNIHTMVREGDARSPKQIAAHLAEEVMKVFGGHPTVQATGSVDLAHGGHLISQLASEYSMLTEQYHYLWVLKYLVRVDVPVAV